MSKKNALDPQEVQTIINDHIQALRLAKGEQAADQTDLYYSKGWFYLRTPGMGREAPALPHRPREIEALTNQLRKQINPRADSDSDGEPD
jgi:hypothetical protein